MQKFNISSILIWVGAGIYVVYIQNRSAKIVDFRNSFSSLLRGGDAKRRGRESGVATCKRFVRCAQLVV